MRKFEFHNKGTVASLGRGEGIAVVGDKKYQGWKAAQLKSWWICATSSLLEDSARPEKGRFL